jgi:hypothetical protein
MKTFTHTILIILLGGLATMSGSAQWSTNAAENNPVTGSDKDQREAVIISDGAGGVFIAWRDYQYTTSIFGGEIHAQRLNSEGIIQWDANGIGVNAGSLNKGHFSPVMTGDGHGGAILGWGRNLGSLYNYDIFSQKLDAGGTKKWPLNDVTVSDASGTESFHQVISDDSSGAIFTWQHLPGTPGSTDIYAQRVDSAGNVRWVEDGVEICMAAESQSWPKLVGDGASGAIITWADSRDGMGESDVYAQRIDAMGTVQWTSDGVEVCNYLYFQGSPVITTDGNGGAIIAWEDGRAGAQDIYAQRLNAAGEPQWAEHGIPVCNASQNQISPYIVSDGADGAIVVWEDLRDGTPDIYAQRINASGEMLWTANGVPVSAAPNEQNAPVAISDRAGGIIITWWDYRSDAFGDIFAQRLNGAGWPMWKKEGVPVSTASSYQMTPVLATDGNEGAIIVWEDFRNGSHYDIYAQRVQKNGYLGTFADGDNDGISDQEEQGPSGDDPDYDGNTDGIPDGQQTHVASFLTHDDQHYVTLMVPDSLTLEYVSAIDNPAPDASGAPSGDNDPYGFFSFYITGLTAGSHTMATLLLHDGPAVSQYYKYGPTPSEAAHWFEFSHDGETGAVIRQDTVFLHLKDGARGDYDITENGTIFEPGGPIQSASSIESPEILSLQLEPNYPNPFRDGTRVAFRIQHASHIVVEVYNASGCLVEQVVNKKWPAGQHTIHWQAAGIPEGIYIMKLTAGQQSKTIRMVKIR